MKKGLVKALGDMTKQKMVGEKPFLHSYMMIVQCTHIDIITLKM